MGNNDHNLNYEDEVQQALLEAANLQKKMIELVNRFYVEHEKADVLSVIDLIYQKGNPKNREFLDDFKVKFEIGELSLEEIQRYNDLQDQHKPLFFE